ncbi:helix-turn-helix transcriptional regulator [Arthrobacter sp. H35-D1]|uniref:helix-turn-helix domain-containing protein n=1 Tax=Arthrobacter sp. H35-D1 TaxID=3046202 RepID=UPI0024BB21D3|nr:helix-turn-helix transcriptional regulator [Arthrobacter sp. H35-D1]MDJ0311674.1 helix-turn-helix transcriptional regulator [Arthrobacter sp. H35-D1]
MAGQKMELGPTGRTVAENMKRVRVDRGLNYADLSRSVTERGRTISPLAIRRMEEGGRRIDVDDLMALAIALGVNPSALLLPHYIGDEDYSDEVTAMPEGTTAADIWAWGDGWQALPHERSNALVIDEDATDMERGRQAYRKYAAEQGQGFLDRIRPSGEVYTTREFIAGVSKTVSDLDPGEWVSLWVHTGKADVGSFRVRAYPEGGWSDMAKFYDRIKTELAGIVDSGLAAPFIKEVLAKRKSNGDS